VLLEGFAPDAFGSGNAGEAAGIGGKVTSSGTAEGCAEGKGLASGEGDGAAVASAVGLGKGFWAKPCERLQKASV